MGAVLAIVLVVFGLALLLFNARFAATAAREQGRLGFRYGPRSILFTRAMSVVVGLAFTLVGLLALLGAIRLDGPTDGP